MVSLPNDVIEKGYIQIKPYKWEQVFFSPSIPFLGTEKDFINSGFAYEYMTLTKSKRIVIDKSNPCSIFNL